MENFSTSSSKLDVDLSFTPFPVQDLDVFVNSESLELMKNPSQWIEEIGSWIRFIQVNSAFKCPEIVLNASQFSLGLELTCLLYTSPSPRDRTRSRMPSSA